MIRCIYYAGNCALWFKNQDYQWWKVSEGDNLQKIDSFIQKIPDLAPGIYKIQWFDPQSGDYITQTEQREVQSDGLLRLSVPSFLKDLACIITKQS